MFDMRAWRRERDAHMRATILSRLQRRAFSYAATIAMPAAATRRDAFFTHARRYERGAARLLFSRCAKERLQCAS